MAARLWSLNIGPTVVGALAVCANIGIVHAQTVQPVPGLDSSDWMQRSAAVNSLTAEQLQNSDVRAALVAALDKENGLIEQTLRDSGESIGVSEKFGEDYGGYYGALLARVIEFADVSDLATLRVLANCAYNADSPFAHRLASVGDPIVPLVLQRLNSDLASIRHNAVAFGTQLLGPDGANTLTQSTFDDLLRAVAVSASDSDDAVRQEATAAILTLDKTPPDIQGVASPSPNVAGWNNSPVVVSFTCQDALSGLAAGSPPPPTTLSAEGNDQSVTGSCSDRAGNSALLTVGPIKIDLTAPTITISASASSLWPPNGRLVPDVISGTVVDGLSGVEASTLSFRVIDEYERVGPTGGVSVGRDGRYSFTVLLEAARNGQDLDGRRYQIIVSGKDKAGNAASVSTLIIVPHDQAK